jgi:hypothetical protein
MKQYLSILAATLILGSAVISCKALAKGAAKYWTKQQLKEFKGKCQEGAIGKFGKEKGIDFCDCASNAMAEKYHNYDDAKLQGFIEILSVAKDCIKK